MAELCDKALLLRRISYSETSLILHILTKEHGRMALMAKGARRPKSPFRAALEPLHVLDVRWRTGRTGMGTLTAAERHPPLLKETAALAGLALSAVAASLFQEGELHGFDALYAAYGILSERPVDSGLLAAVWYLLANSGWVGDLDVCWVCGQPANTVSWHQGHLHCVACGRGESVSTGLKRGISGHMHSAQVLLSRQDKQVWRRMVQDVLQTHGLRALSDAL